MQIETQESTLPFVLLWAENLPYESRSRTDIVFSPSVSGLVHTDSIHDHGESSNDISSGGEALDTTL